MKKEFKKTRYKDLFYRYVRPEYWTFCEISTPPEPYQPANIGPIYATKEELLGDLENFATARGFTQ